MEALNQAPWVDLGVNFVDYIYSLFSWSAKMKIVSPGRLETDMPGTGVVKLAGGVDRTSG